MLSFGSLAMLKELPSEARSNLEMDGAPDTQMVSRY